MLREPDVLQGTHRSGRVAYSKDDIAAILDSKTLHAEELDKSTALDTIYYSSKVPFGFNYADGEANFGSDDDTMMGHGTHVAGIIAGNLTGADQEQFNMTSLGIAPEAQLVIMKVFDQGGNCYFDYLIAAIEDAITLGVDCANLSLGLSSGPYYYEGVTEVYDAATTAVSASASPPATMALPAPRASGAMSRSSPRASPAARWACPARSTPS